MKKIALIALAFILAGSGFAGKDRYTRMINYQKLAVDSDGTEKTAATYTLNGNFIANKGDSVRIDAWDISADNTNAKTLAMYWGSYTKALFHCEDNTDVLGNTVTDVGTPVWSAVQKKFGSKSFYGDGSSANYIYMADSESWNFAGGYWSIDFWVYHPTAADQATANYSVIGTGNDNNNLMWIRTVGHASNASLRGGLYFTWKTSSTAILTLGGYLLLTPDAWHHVEISEAGDNFYMFVDGVLVDSETSTSRMPNWTGGFRIGSYGGGSAGYYFYGYLDEIRIRKGVASHVSAFTAPAAAYATGQQPLITFTNSVAGLDKDRVYCEVTKSGTNARSYVCMAEAAKIFTPSSGVFYPDDKESPVLYYTTNAANGDLTTHGFSVTVNPAWYMDTFGGFSTSQNRRRVLYVDNSHVASGAGAAVTAGEYTLHKGLFNKAYQAMFGTESYTPAVSKPVLRITTYGTTSSGAGNRIYKILIGPSGSQTTISNKTYTLISSTYWNQCDIIRTGLNAQKYVCWTCTGANNCGEPEQGALTMTQSASQVIDHTIEGATDLTTKTGFKVEFIDNK